MIHWTAAGAVSTPTTVQIRLSAITADSFRVGVSPPESTLSVEDFRRNLNYFSVDLDTPRSTPCHSLTLSGLPTQFADYLDVLAAMPRFQYCTLHLPDTTIDWTQLYPYRQLFDRLVLPISPKTISDVPHWAGLLTQFMLPLTAEQPDQIDWFIRWIHQVQPQHLLLSYPAPLNQQRPMSLQSLRTFLSEVATHCADMTTIQVRGIPPCLLQTTIIPLENISSKTSNRWYVDVDHQCVNARLFFPDILHFHKDDQCRFCRFGASCDGFFLRHLESMNTTLRSIVEEIIP